MSSRPFSLTWRKWAAMAFMPHPDCVGTITVAAAGQLGVGSDLDDAIAGIEQAVAPLNQDAVDIWSLGHGELLFSR